MIISRWALGLVIALSPALSNAQATDSKPAAPTDIDSDNVGLVGSVFITGATVIDVCGDEGPPGATSGWDHETGVQPCEALVMGLYNGFLYGTTYGGFETCVPETIGSEQIVPLFTDYVRAEGSAEWNHAGDLMADLFQNLGWGGYEGEACLAGQDQVADGDNVAPSEAAGGDTGDTLAGQVARADLAEGERVYGMCNACHAVREGAPNLIGRALWQIVGRPVASVDGYGYSDALNALGQTAGVWDLTSLHDYVDNSQAAVPGTSMMFRGVRDPADRINLLAYLASLTAN